jgi:hypothetical protein
MSLLPEWQVENEIEKRLSHFEKLELSPIDTSKATEWHKVRHLWTVAFERIGAMPFLENNVPPVEDVRGDAPPRNASVEAKQEWFDKRNSARIKGPANVRKDKILVHAIIRALSGDTMNIVRGATTAHEIWTNINSCFQRTAAQTSLHAENEWRSLDIKNFKNYPAYIGEFRPKLKLLQNIRESLGEAPLTEKAIVQQFFRGLSTPEWKHQGSIWLGRDADDESNNLAYWDATCERHYQTYVHDSVDDGFKAAVTDESVKLLKKRTLDQPNPNYKGKNYDPNYKRKFAKADHNNGRSVAQFTSREEAKKPTEYPNRPKDDAERQREIEKYSKATNSKPKKSRGDDVCFKCGKKGHWSNECRSNIQKAKVLIVTRLSPADKEPHEAEKVEKREGLTKSAQKREIKHKANAKNDLTSVDH